LPDRIAAQQAVKPSYAEHQPCFGVDFSHVFPLFRMMSGTCGKY
jgi:hypothetical protein